MEKIILYSTGCPRCSVLKTKLESKGVLFDEISSVEELMSLGIDEVPVLKVNGSLYEFKDAVNWINNYDGGVE